MTNKRDPLEPFRAGEAMSHDDVLALILRDVARSLRQHLEGGGIPWGGEFSARVIHPVHWNWGIESPPVFSLKTTHFGEPADVFISERPTGVASSGWEFNYPTPPGGGPDKSIIVSGLRFLEVAGGAVMRRRGEERTYHLYLTREEIEQLQEADEERREFEIKNRFIPRVFTRTYLDRETSGQKYSVELSISFGAIQVDNHESKYIPGPPGDFAYLPMIIGIFGKGLDLEPLPVEEKRELWQEILDFLEHEIGRHEPEGQGDLFEKRELLAPEKPGKIPGAFGVFAPMLEKSHLITTGEVVSDVENHPLSQLLYSAEVAEMAKRNKSGASIIFSSGPELMQELHIAELCQRHPAIREDIKALGMQALDLGGVFKMRVYLALSRIASRQRGTMKRPGEIILRNWNELCREIDPGFDKMKRGPRNNFRRRVQRAVAVMWGISLYFTYNRPLKKEVPVKGSRGKLKKMVKVNERHIVRERWIDDWHNVEEDGRRKHKIVLRLGIYSDDYTKNLGAAVLYLLCTIEHECDQRLFIRLQRETWLEKNMSRAKLIEWGGWRSNDRARNEQYLARALARYVEIGYLQEATFLPDTEQYHLLKHQDHYFPRGLLSPMKYPAIEGEQGTLDITESKESIP